MQSLTQAEEFGAKKFLGACGGFSRRMTYDLGLCRLRRLPLKTFGPKGCCPVLNVDCVAGAPKKIA